MYLVLMFISLDNAILELIVKIFVGTVVYILFLWLIKDEFFLKIVRELMMKINFRKRFR